MIDIFKKGHIIKLKQSGKSLREISKLTNTSRKTVTKICKDYENNIIELNNTTDFDKQKLIQEKIIEKPKYNSSNRRKIKYTDEIDSLIDEILFEEDKKDVLLGKNHKQKLTLSGIHQLVVDQGHDISYSTVANGVRKKRNKVKETFIRQKHEFGERLEFDFGEVKLIINGITSKYYIAVLSSPASNYRMAYLYDNQTKKAFQDAHVQFFEHVQGVYNEIVYDNMKNVVSKFIGRNEKILNEDLIKLSIYYDFNINVTNCFRGNEKGHVEGSVKYIRSQVFSKKYKFQSIEHARKYLSNALVQLNKKSKIEQERSFLKEPKPKLELSELLRLKVDKYSTIRVENNFYSVPEDLNRKEVNVKNYISYIEIFYNHEFICKHEKIEGHLQYKLDIKHFLKTFKTKPNALLNSQALANNRELKAIYHKYYRNKPKLFLELIEQHKNKSSLKLNEILKTNYSAQAKVEKLEDKIVNEAKKQLSVYTNILKGVEYGTN